MYGRVGVSLVAVLLLGTCSAFLCTRVAAELPMREYEHAAGFRVPIPSEWTLSEDERIEGVTIETVLTGPHHDGYTTSLLIETDRDPTVREGNVYLRQLVDAVVQGLPGSFISEEPRYRTIAGHSGVVFAATDRSAPPTIIVKAAILVSDPHDRYWFLFLAAHEGYMHLYNDTFALMVDEFEITIQPGSLGAAGVVGGVVALVGVIVAILIAVRWSRKRKPVPAFPTFPTLAPPPPPPPLPTWAPPIPTAAPVLGAIAGPQTCASCGRVSPSTYRFCVSCGSPFPLPAPPAPESAVPTPPNSETPPGPPPLS